VFPHIVMMKEMHLNRVDATPRMRHVTAMFAALAVVVMGGLSGGVATAVRAQEPEANHKAYDELLDTNVRDGLVYYRALKGQRGALDRYVAALGSASIDSAPRDEQIAFWLNAYNALVLQTVIDHYPIVQRTRDYPARSIRQIPGAFERTTHRVAGRTVTLDQIEQTVLQPFGDPRIYLALGRGAVGSGRLRSEAYSAANVERQLAGMANECVNHAQCADIDRVTGKVKANSIFSWRDKEFVAAYADKAPAVFSTRSPVERAVLAFIQPKLVTTEREFLDKNEFKVEFIPFDWTLNDLTGRAGR
jgi:hypothetical protein